MSKKSLAPSRAHASFASPDALKLLIRDEIARALGGEIRPTPSKLADTLSADMRRAKKGATETELMRATVMGWPAGLDPTKWVDAKVARTALGGVSGTSLLNLRNKGVLEVHKISARKFLYGWESILRILAARDLG